MVGVLKDLPLGRASNSRLLLGGVLAIVLHPSPVETHGGILPGRMSWSIVLVAGATGTFAHLGSWPHE
jgi:hypothetical protein